MSVRIIYICRKRVCNTDGDIEEILEEANTCLDDPEDVSVSGIVVLYLSSVWYECMEWYGFGIHIPYHMVLF